MQVKNLGQHINFSQFIRTQPHLQKYIHTLERKKKLNIIDTISILNDTFKSINGGINQ